jgi:hypothetical protein
MSSRTSARGRWADRDTAAAGTLLLECQAGSLEHAAERGELFVREVQLASLEPADVDRTDADEQAQFVKRPAKEFARLIALCGCNQS